jgi:hypothetical protein
VFCYDDNGNLTADGDATAGFVYLVACPELVSGT